MYIIKTNVTSKFENQEFDSFDQAWLAIESFLGSDAEEDELADFTVVEK